MVFVDLRIFLVYGGLLCVYLFWCLLLFSAWSGRLGRAGGVSTLGFSGIYGAVICVAWVSGWVCIVWVVIR